MLRGAGHPFENFMTCVPDCYDPKLPWSFRAKNFQIFEMGFDNENQNIDELEAHLNRLDEVFEKLMDLFSIKQVQNWNYWTFQVMDVVLITERYAESVLLMRKKLCMNLLDLFQPPTKVHSHDEFEFSDKQKMNFYEFQKLDLHMYNVRISESFVKFETQTWVNH